MDSCKQNQQKQQRQRQHNNGVVANNNIINNNNNNNMQTCLSNNSADNGEDITGGLHVGDISGVDPIAVNKLIVNELNQLSLDRREHVLEEIHGVKNGGGALQYGSANDQRRQEEEIDNAMRKFQEALDQYYFSEKAAITKTATITTPTPAEGDHNDNYDEYSNYKFPAYRYAREQGSELIHDRGFRLIFFGWQEEGGTGLSCPKQAATRMLNYLEFVREIYDTSDVLHRPICLSDFSESAKEIIYEEGPLQILPVRDPSGRRVCVYLRDVGCPFLIMVRATSSNKDKRRLDSDSDSVRFGSVRFVRAALH